MSLTVSRNLTIRSGQGDYTAEFFEGIDALVDACRGAATKVLLVDSNVDRLYGFSGKLGLPTLTIDATEEQKTIDGVTRVLKFFQEQGCNRYTTVLAIGGGIIQDIATFACHIYYRGIGYVLVPTTLLSMCDSCIGAKCGINFGDFKNQLGVFQSPRRVLICADLLDTLSDVDVVSGYGEILKLTLTGSREDYDDLVRALSGGNFRNPQLMDLISRTLAVKKAVIEEDEYESQLRMILNYGHTFGHALEAITKHAVPHGLGVAWGIDVANLISVRRGLLSQADYDEIHRFRAKYFPVQVNVTAAQLVHAARRDKKSGAGVVTMALLRKPGKVDLVKVAFDDELNRNLEEFLTSDATNRN